MNPTEMGGMKDAKAERGKNEESPSASSRVFEQDAGG